MRLLLIGAGGFLGAILRHLVGGWVQSLSGQAAFPAGTLGVNVIGCFAIGAVIELSETRGFLGPDARAFLAIGVIGGFTTFSTFAHETGEAARGGAVLAAVANVAASVGLGLLAAWAGRVAVHGIWR
jgi:CrcB protein